MANDTARIICVHCDEPIALAPVVEEWVDGDGEDRCRDDGGHRPVLSTDDIPALRDGWDEDRLEDAGQYADWMGR